VRSLRGRLVRPTADPAGNHQADGSRSPSASGNPNLARGVRAGRCHRASARWSRTRPRALSSRGFPIKRAEDAASVLIESPVWLSRLWATSVAAPTRRAGRVPLRWPRRLTEPMMPFRRQHGLPRTDRPASAARSAWDGPTGSSVSATSSLHPVSGGRQTSGRGGAGPAVSLSRMRGSRPAHAPASSEVEPGLDQP
jgi:hypothetical protein